MKKKFVQLTTIEGEVWIRPDFVCSVRNENSSEFPTAVSVDVRGGQTYYVKESEQEVVALIS